MKKVGILNIGTELLVGHTVNTHASYLSNILNDWGYGVYWHMSVGDNKERILSAMNFMADPCDLLILTGGLGPTGDDITRECVAEFLGVKLERDDKTLINMEEYFKERKVEMTKNNKKQAQFPKGSIIMENPLGTAPGFMVKGENITICALPGPPRELHRMVENPLKNLLLEGQSKLYNKFIHLSGIGESTIADIIQDIFENQTDPSIGIYTTGEYIKLRLSTMKTSKEEADRLFQPIIDLIRERLGQYIFSYDNQSIEEKLLAELKKKNYKIAFAESCTGGLLSKAITDISGASEVFELGIVSYSNKMKEEVLGVGSKSLEKHGAVSKETVEEMLKGIKEASKADICIAVSGIAGPNSDESKKPVGLVFIAYDINGESYTKKYQFSGDRDRIRQRTKVSAFLELINKIS